MKRTDESFSMKASEAAAIVGVIAKTLIRQAQIGLLEYRLRGNGELPRYYFHPDDVEALRKRYRVGFRGEPTKRKAVAAV